MPAAAKPDAAKLDGGAGAEVADPGSIPDTGWAAEAQPGDPPELPAVSFDRHPGSYRHWRLRVDGPVGWLEMDVDEHGGLVPGYELKLNSYDLGVDIELYDAVQRLRFEHPEVRAVVLTSFRGESPDPALPRPMPIYSRPASSASARL